MALQEAAFPGADHRFLPGFGAELAVDRSEVGLQGVGRDEQVCCELAQRGRAGSIRKIVSSLSVSGSNSPRCAGARRLGALFFGQPRGDQRPRVDAMPQNAAGLTHQRAGSTSATWWVAAAG
jgi:hypothetical protein